MSEITHNLDDLGFGERALQAGSSRILNRDGTFNVRREGRSFWQSANPYHLLLSASWMRFNLMLLGLYLIITSIFAIGFYAVGSDAVGGSTDSSNVGRLADAFYFSVQTITTVGYGHLIPNGTIANLMVTLEAAFGMAGVAVAAGLIFARVAAPSAKVLFSGAGLIDSKSSRPAFKFRMVNGARSELVDAKARVILAKTESQFGIRTRRFHELPLERDQIAFFSLDWTVVHYITDDSPLRGMDAKDLKDANVEFLILINAIDDGAYQTVHARSSYRWDEVIWDKKFVDMFRKRPDGRITVDLRLLHHVEAIDTESHPAYTIWET